MLRRTLPLCLLATACNVTTFVPNEDYCGINGGDAYCREQAPQTPYCVLSSKACFEGEGLAVHDLGCVAEQPDQTCRQACGIGNSDACLDPTASSSSSTTEDETESSTTQDPTTDTDESSSSTGAECMNNDDCTDAAPYCLEGTCVPCSGALDGDIACMEIDPATPLCVDDVCVQCSTEDSSACEGMTPVCGDAGSCVGCEFHEQCEALGSPACDFADGSCFDPATAEEVNLSTPGALATAVGNVEGGEHVALLITGSLSNQSATVDGGKVIAIVSADGDAQNIQGAGASSILTVSGPGSTAILHRVVLQGSGARGIDVNTSGTLYADAVQVVGNDGGGIMLGTATTGRLRNCMVGADVNTDAISSSNATLELLYTTAVGNGAFGENTSYALGCSGGSVDVRNSILASRSDDAVDCSADIVNSFEAEGGGFDEGWFDLDGGDLSIQNGANTSGFSSAAIWELGDPPTDFDGDARPSTDDSADFAGADIP